VFVPLQLGSNYHLGKYFPIITFPLGILTSSDLERCVHVNRKSLKGKFDPLYLMPYSTPKGTNDSVSTEENTKLRALYQNRNLAINAPTKRSELEKLFSIIFLN